jgi:hypothetical protein
VNKLEGPPNNGLKLTSARCPERSQLNPVLGRPWRTLVKPAFVMLLSLSLVACDTMISDRIRITPPPTAGVSALSQEKPLVFVRETLTACHLKRGQSSMGETWEWEDPDHPPGLQATIEPAAGSVLVRMSQGLYGPIGETEKYRSVKEALVGGAKRRFGATSVKVE